MLEPLSALSLAAAIIQFVDFSSKILVTGYETYRSTAGATQEQVDLQQLTHSLYKFQDQLGTPSTQPTPDQKILEELARKCSLLAGDLLRLLDALKVEEQGTASHTGQLSAGVSVSAEKRRDQKVGRAIGWHQQTDQLQTAVHDPVSVNPPLLYKIVESSRTWFTGTAHALNALS